MLSHGSPVKGRRISNQMSCHAKGLKKKTASEIEIPRELDASFIMQNSQYEYLRSHMNHCSSEEKVAKKPKKKKSSERSMAIKKSQQLYCKKKKKSQNIKKSVSAERVKVEHSYLSPEFVKRKKAATFFSNDKSAPISLQEHRKQMGLEFLNKVTTRRRDKILERNRLSSVEKPQTTPEKRKSLFSPNQLIELKHYMKEKKKFYSQIENFKQQSQVDRRKLIDENLRSLAELAAKRNSLSNSRSPPRESVTKSNKPLMLSYVAKKSRKSTGKKQSAPKSLKDQFKQLEQRYKTLKVKNSIQTLNSDISLRESRDYEQEMKAQASRIIQKRIRGYLVRKRYKEVLKEHRQKMEFQKVLKQEAQKWEDLKIFVLDLYKNKDMITMEDFMDVLVQYANFNKENVGRPVQPPLMKPKIRLEPKEVFPPQIGQILNLRSELIKEREKKERDLLKSMLIQERISPRSFGRKEEEIVKWGQAELEMLARSKEAIKEGWIKAYETIQKTQKDLRFVQRLGDEQFQHIMPISVSQSNLLKNQLNDLQMNLLRQSYSEENLLEMRKEQAQIGQPSNAVTYNSNNSNKSLSSYIQGLEDVPLELDQQVRETPKYQFYVQTHVAFIKNYLDEIKAIVLETYQPHFITQINTPIGPTPFEILRFFRMTEDMLEESLEGGFIHQAVLNLEVFTRREKLQVGQDEFMNELERIHNKAIFDAYNEALDYHRPFGIKGRPLPWRKSGFKQKVRDIQTILHRAGLRVIGWAEMLCGIIPPQQNAQENNDLLPQIREERLDKMLNQEIIENDDRWQEFDEEQTEVGLELSELVFDHLISEMLGELVQPQKTQKFRSPILLK